MSRRRLIVIVASAAAAATATGLLLVGGPALAGEQNAAPTAATTSAPSGAAALRELRTSDNRGTFYTLSEREAKAAVHRFGFRETPDAAGLFLLTKAGQDTRPVHRLRLRSGAMTYLTSINDTERRRLADPADPNRRFDDEGVLGHVYANPRPGTVALYRYSRNSDWRLGKDTRQDLVRAGYANDGLVGYVPAR